MYVTGAAGICIDRSYAMVTMERCLFGSRAGKKTKDEICMIKMFIIWLLLPWAFGA